MLPTRCYNSHTPNSNASISTYIHTYKLPTRHTQHLTPCARIHFKSKFTDINKENSNDNANSNNNNSNDNACSCECGRRQVAATARQRVTNDLKGNEHKLRD